MFSVSFCIFPRVFSFCLQPFPVSVTSSIRHTSRYVSRIFCILCDLCRGAVGIVLVRKCSLGQHQSPRNTSPWLGWICVLLVGGSVLSLSSARRFLRIRLQYDFRRDTSLPWCLCGRLRCRLRTDIFRRVFVYPVSLALFSQLAENNLIIGSLNKRVKTMD